MTGATFAAPYTVRARAGAPVSAPCEWSEIETGRIEPKSFTVRNMTSRLKETGDLWAGIYRRGRSLSRAMAQLRRRQGS